MMGAIRGRCHCGTVAYTVNGEIGTILASFARLPER